MARPLTPSQKGAYETIQREGSIQKGDGWTLRTARALTHRGLVELEERRRGDGVVYFWRASRPIAAKPAEPDTRPVPSGTDVIRLGVRNPATEEITYTAVRHVHQSEGLRGALRVLGISDRDMAQGSGGRYTTQDGRRVFVWRRLEDGALREFVCGGEVYRLQPHPEFPDTWAVIHLETGDVMAADTDPAAAERRTREDVAALNQALRRGK